jgi:hypothetical protein
MDFIYLYLFIDTFNSSGYIANDVTVNLENMLKEAAAAYFGIGLLSRNFRRSIEENLARVAGGWTDICKWNFRIRSMGYRSAATLDSVSAELAKYVLPANHAISGENLWNGSSQAVL